MNAGSWSILIHLDTRLGGRGLGLAVILRPVRTWRDGDECLANAVFVMWTLQSYNTRPS